MEGREEMVRGESSWLRLVTGVVRLGGMGGEGLAGTRLVPPCDNSAVEYYTKKINEVKVFQKKVVLKKRSK